MKHILLTLLILPLYAISQEKNIFSKINGEIYANYLVNTKQYNLALEEYNRLLFLKPNDSAYKINIIALNYLNNNYNQVEKNHVDLFKKEESFLADLYLTKSFFKQNNFNKASTFLIKNNSLDKEQKKNYLFFSYLLDENYNDAKNLDIKNKNYQILLSNYNSIKKKNKFLAASLSTIMPGLGKVYTKDWKDALISLLAVGSSGFQAYRILKKNNKNPLGWAFATLSTGFYLGNIYGSYKAAKQYNHRKKDEYKKEITDVLNTDLISK